MTGPFSDYARLHIADRICMPRGAFPGEAALAKELEAALARHQLTVQPESLNGFTLIVPRFHKGGRIEKGELNRSRLYSLVTPDQVLAGVRAHIAAIAAANGPGRVWFLDVPGGLMMEEVDIVNGALLEGDDTKYAIQRTYFGHEAQIRWEG